MRRFSVITIRLLNMLNVLQKLMLFTVELHEKMIMWLFFCLTFQLKNHDGTPTKQKLKIHFV